MENPRFFLYGRGSEWGIGHLSQICAYARGIKKVMPQSDVIIASGSKLTHYLVQLLPQSVEFIKLPSVRLSKLKGGTFFPEKVRRPLKEVFSMRKDILCSIFVRFRPHVIMVNHAAFGIGGNELKPILNMIDTQKKLKEAQFPIRIYCPIPINNLTHSIKTKIMDQKGIDMISRRQHYISLINNHYDYIFLGVTSDVFWCNYVLYKKQWPKTILQKMFFHGYFTNYDGEKFLKDSEIKKKISLKNKEKLIVLSCGGGRDGFEILKLFIEVHPFIKQPVKSILFPGPYMPEEEVRYLKRLIQEKKNLYIETYKAGVEFSLADWMHAADLFIGMGGYNTLAEVLTTRVRAIIIPRHPKIEEEQFIHSSILKEKNLIEMIDPDRVNKDGLLKAIQNNLHLGKLKKEETSYMINGSIKAAKKIKALIRCH